MRYGIFDHVEQRLDVGPAQQYTERLRFAELAEAAGFYCYHVVEHHRAPLCLAPNQAVYLAAIAQRTQRLRLATLVYVLPLHHPIRLLEESCLMDYMQRYAAETGANYFVGSFHWGDLSHQEACRSLELFASEAMPSVQ